MTEEINKRITLIEDIVSTSLFNEDTIEIIIDGIMSGDEILQSVSAMAINSLPDELKTQASNMLVAEIENDNIAVRNLVAECLQSLGEYSINDLLKYLKSENYDTRKFACDLLGLIADSSIYKEIEPLLDDIDLNVVLSAIETLGNIGSKESVDVIISKYADNDATNATILESLGKIESDKAIDFIVGKIEDDNELIKICAIDSLANCGNDQSICDLLMKQIPKSSELLIGVILKTIYAIANKIDYEVILPENFRVYSIASLKDEDKDIRIAALLSLGQKYTENEVEFIFNELDFDNHLLLELFFFNLISYNDENILEKIINTVLAGNQQLSILEIFTIFSSFWNSIPLYKRIVCFKIILNYLISENTSRAYDLYDYFWSMDSEAVESVIIEMKNSEDSERINQFLSQKLIEYQNLS